VVIACHRMLQLNDCPSWCKQDRLDIRRPECRIRNLFKTPSIEFERRKEQSCIERDKRLFAACLFLPLRAVAILGQADY
jgi:hypothetical protein